MEFETWNEDIKEEWCKALESGEYEQGTGRLKAGNKFCCLGVRADLLVKKGIGLWEPQIGLGNSYLCPITKGSGRGFLPGIAGIPAGSVNTKALLEESQNLGLNDSQVNFLESCELEEIRLARLNDSELFGFKTIAKIIRKFIP